MLNRFGVRVALFLLPASLFIVTLFFSLFGTLWGLVPLLFWLATLNRVLDLGLLFSVDQSAQTILYQPLPASERTRIQTIDNGIVRMTAVGLAGGLLILLNRVLAASVVQMSYVLLVVLVVWLAVVWLTARAYPQRLAAVFVVAGSAVSPCLSMTAIPSACCATRCAVRVPAPRSMPSMFWLATGRNWWARRCPIYCATRRRRYGWRRCATLKPCASAAAAILQSFPRAYRFPLQAGREAICSIIGEALPPLLVKKQARVLLEHIESFR